MPAAAESGRQAASNFMMFQLVLQFPLSEDFDFDALLEFETRLTFELGNEHVVDPHAFGTDEVNIFIHTDSPEIAFQKAVVTLSAQLASTFKAAYRTINSVQYRWLHPANHEGEFRIA